MRITEIKQEHIGREVSFDGDEWLKVIAIHGDECWLEDEEGDHSTSRCREDWELKDLSEPKKKPSDIILYKSDNELHFHEGRKFEVHRTVCAILDFLDDQAEEKKT